MILAQKLKLVSIENGKLVDDNKKLKELNETINKEKELLRDLIDRSKQPYSYLIKKIEEIELELIRTKEDLNSKNSYIKRITNENELQEQKITNLSSDLKSVLNNRKKLECIEEVMLKMSSIKDSNEMIDDQGQKVNLQSSIPIVMTKGSKLYESTDNQKDVKSSEDYPKWYLTLQSKKNLNNKN